MKENIYTYMSEQAENSGDHFEMYKNTEAGCCAPGTNSAVGQIHFKEQTQKNRSDLWLPGAIGGGPGRRWPKVQTVSYKVGKYYGRNVHSGKRG